MSTIKNAYDIKAGETFEVDGKTYTATKDARGEFRPYIEAKYEVNGEQVTGEIVLYHGQQVEILPQ